MVKKTKIAAAVGESAKEETVVEAIVNVRSSLMASLSAMIELKEKFDIDVSFNIAPDKDTGRLNLLNFKATKTYQ